MVKNFIFAAFVLIFCISLIASESTVASDNFETNTWEGGNGWISGWWHEGDSKIINTASPFEGDYHLRLRARNGYVDRVLDLSSFSDAKISFYAKANSLEQSDYVVFLVSSDGLNWNILKTFTPLDSDNIYKNYEFDLTQYGLTQNVWIAFDSEMSGTGDYLYVDDFKIITSENITQPESFIPPSWHIQFNPTPLTPAGDVDYWNLDLFDVPSETMQNLSSQGVFVMCYFSAGSFEDWRLDASQFPPYCLGNSNGWPGERWLDIRCPEVREIMKSRIDLGISKRCDGFDPDNMDAYGNNNGLNLTEQDAIDYYNFLADYIHSQGKKIGLKNALTIIDDVLHNMDWAINEQCFQYNECSYLTPVVNAGKPVFNIEYGGQAKANKVCPQANALGFSTLIKKTSLNEFEISCLK
jgi:hypothetical protein